ATTAPAAPQRLTVMMPFPLSINFIADVAGKSGGFMEAEGVDLDLQFAPGAPQALQQLAAGNVTVIRNGPVEMLLADVNEGAPFVSIGMVNQRTNYTLTSAPEEAFALADLGGLTVGLPTLGGNAEFVLDLLLRAEGVDPTTVQRQAVGNEASGYAVLQEGLVNALLVSRSTVAGIRALGEEPHVDMLSDVNPLLGTNLVTTRQFLDEQHDLIVSYLAALHATMLAINDEAQRTDLITVVRDDDWDLPQLDDPERASSIIAATAGQWFEEGEENLLRNIPERWDRGVAQLVELGVVPEGTAAADYYTNDLLDEALA
ncbi:MAG: ABC transporter substrate-binding protein, partial [Actinomycetota bacterium]|nr:ABC transporter substrate-binding protein [Actinomycetota bacterium]